MNCIIGLTKKMSRILFLGAGASYDASYPLTPCIFEELDKFYKNNQVNDYSKRWNQFNQALQNFPKDLEFLTKSKNPEIILTLPDLLEEAKLEYENKLISDADISLASGKSIHQSIILKIRQICTRKYRIDAAKIKNDFVILLGHYFLMKHCEDQTRKLPNYLTSMVTSFDCIITTNWDTLAERILHTNNKWFPSDGYGFPRRIKENFNNGHIINYPPSSTKVLKLHGSVGWHQRAETFYLSQYNYLQYLIPNICDENAPQMGGGPDEDPVVLYPSYLKQLDSPILLSVWEQARKALDHASSITVVGYSLPKADVAIRALLLSIRTNAATIKIIDPCSKNSATRKRWEDFFVSSGKSANFIEKTADQYFNTSSKSR